MTSKLKERAVLPVDPVTGQWFINAIGTSDAECQANLTFIELSDEQVGRIEFVPVEITLPDGGGDE